VFTLKELAVIFISTANNGANEMRSILPPKANNKKFNVCEKLNASSTHWAYSKPAQAYQDGFDFQLETILADEIEFASTNGKEINLSFWIFNSYNEACDEAKAILDTHKDIKKMFEH
jgi:hypothetical protein